MHPAPSLILFSTLSGAGLGYFTMLGLGISTSTGMVAFWQFALGFVMVGAGLLFSTFHLGNPQRAALAFTQWRSSWLSREAIAAMATLALMGVFAAGAVFFARIWHPVGWLGAAVSVLTVITTAMIYAQMVTVPRWNSRLTPALFVTNALAAGAILSGVPQLALSVLIVLAGLQVWAWRTGDSRPRERGHTLGSATGLGGAGTVRMFEPPHTGENYLLKEFAFQVARRQAAKLRVICILTMCVIPGLLLLIAAHPSVILVAFAVHLLGTLVSRWLFFAQAEHVVQLYYGRQLA